MMAAGCATSRGATSSTASTEGADDEVMYAPPEDADQPIKVPRGAPVLEEYAEPTSDVTPAPPQDAAPGEPPPTSISRTRLDQLLEFGPAWGLSQVVVSPKRVDGAFQGFEITDFSPEAREVMSPPLQEGDVITHLNGVRLQTPTDYDEAWKLSRTVSTIRIDYMRDGDAVYTEWDVQD